MNKIFLVPLMTFLLVSCGEHSDYDVTKFTGDYRYYAGIAEFFDCKEHRKYYVDDSGINIDLQTEYLKLGLKDKDDVYIKIEGYLKEVTKMEGMDPTTVFVPVKLLSLDETRGCERGRMEGF